MEIHWGPLPGVQYLGFLLSFTINAALGLHSTISDLSQSSLDSLPHNSFWVERRNHQAASHKREVQRVLACTSWGGKIDHFSYIAAFFFTLLCT